MSNILEKLSRIQSELKAPKNQRNDFGGFSYRSCEDILEAVKPLLKENGAALTIRDELVCIGTRYYIKATAALQDIESGETVDVSAYAREPENRPKMDEAQVTGSSSSYARKYALNGLFCIDDAKDPDCTNTGAQNQQTGSRTQNLQNGSRTQNRGRPAAGRSQNRQQANERPIAQNELNALRSTADQKGIPYETVAQRYGKKQLEDLTVSEFLKAMKALEKSKDVEQQINMTEWQQYENEMPFM